MNIDMNTEIAPKIGYPWNNLETPRISEKFVLLVRPSLVSSLVSSREPDLGYSRSWLIPEFLVLTGGNYRATVCNSLLQIVSELLLAFL